MLKILNYNQEVVSSIMVYRGKYKRLYEKRYKPLYEEYIKKTKQDLVLIKPIDYSSPLPKLPNQGRNKEELIILEQHAENINDRFDEIEKAYLELEKVYEELIKLDKKFQEEASTDEEELPKTVEVIKVEAKPDIVPLKLELEQEEYADDLINELAAALEEDDKKRALNLFERDVMSKISNPAAKSQKSGVEISGETAILVSPDIDRGYVTPVLRNSN